jgi:hypothetical protein
MVSQLLGSYVLFAFFLIYFLVSVSRCLRGESSSDKTIRAGIVQEVSTYANTRQSLEMPSRSVESQRTPVPYVRASTYSLPGFK